MQAMSAYDFNVQLSIGERAESHLDMFFLKHYRIAKAAPEEQRRGIDRWFQYQDGPVRAVEYKCDLKAAETGHFFIETVSVDRASVAGWARSSESYFLVLFVPQLGNMYFLHTKALRARLPEWQKSYRQATCRNSDYSSQGVLVPIKEVAALALRVVNIGRMEV